MPTSDSTNGHVPNYLLCNNDTLRKATRNLTRLYDDALAPSTLRIGQLSMLLHIHELDRPTIKRLAQVLVMDESALGHSLKPLIRDGFVRLVPNPADRRSKLTTLTKSGQKKLEETSALWADAQSKFEQVFGADKAEALRVAMITLTSPQFTEAYAALMAMGASGTTTCVEK
jgi:DNA-binding MarR family transcriptional regulator